MLENGTGCGCPSGMVKGGDNCTCPVGFTLEADAGCKGEKGDRTSVSLKCVAMKHQ